MTTFKTLQKAEKRDFRQKCSAGLESGRSMVEMLGVLAVIGVLSVAGISGYTVTMNKFKANRIMEEIVQRLPEISFAMQRGQNPAEFEKDVWGGHISLRAVGGVSADSVVIDLTTPKGTDAFFAMQVSDLPGSTCKSLADSFQNTTGIHHVKSDCDKGEKSQVEAIYCYDLVASCSEYKFDTGTVGKSGTNGGDTANNYTGNNGAGGNGGSSGNNGTGTGTGGGGATGNNGTGGNGGNSGNNGTGTGDDGNNTSQSEDGTCPDGYGIEKGECMECDPGTYHRKDMSAPECQKCPAGTYQKEAKGTKCEVCGIGRYSDVEGRTTECDSCGENETTYVNTRAKSKAECVCDVGYARNAEGKCVSCPGKTTYDNEPCCRSGEQYNETSKACEPCPEGTYKDKAGYTQCTKCPSDKPYTFDRGNNYASACTAERDCARGSNECGCQEDDNSHYRTCALNSEPCDGGNGRCQFGQCVPKSKLGCMKNADCSSGEYCAVTYSNGNGWCKHEYIESGKCKTPEQGTAYTLGGAAGTAMIAPVEMNFASAENWCEAQGMFLLDTNENAGYSQRMYDMCKANNLSNYWTTHSGSGSWNGRAYTHVAFGTYVNSDGSESVAAMDGGWTPNSALRGVVCIK